ncbi:MAG: metalloprotease TldD, partial [Rhodobacteraceae bacterium]|nr:metalloprotease TldD [Paracoccaceae bacterium]
MTDQPDGFRPFATALDRDRAQRLLNRALEGADDGELFLERRRSEALVFDDGRLKTASFDAAEGFGLRAVCGEATGYAHSTEMSEAALTRAVDTVRLAVGAGGALAAPPQATNRPLYTDADPI